MCSCPCGYDRRGPSSEVVTQAIVTEAIVPSMIVTAARFSGAAVGASARASAGRAEKARAGRQDRPALWLARLALTDFRCYARAQLESDRRPLVLTGPNGVGKTNLLEAISFLVPGRGLRRARLGEIDRRPPGRDPKATGRTWAVSAEAMTPEGPRVLGTGRDPAGAKAEEAGRERRLVKIDGALVRSQRMLGEILNVIWLTPRMDGLFREGAAGRRRFLDRLVYGFDPAHAGRISAYEHALRERARILRSGGDDPAWLATLEDGLAGHGVAIAAARRDMVASLAEACATGGGDFPRAGLSIAGEVESWLDEMPALGAEDSLRARLAEAREGDRQSGRAGLGPHRSDLLVTHLEKDLPANLCSTGEQKALLVSIILAHARLVTLHRGAAPIMLLDEIAAHLDEARRAALFAEVLALGAQAWLTGTDRGLFSEMGDAAQFYEVRNAEIRPAA